MFFGDASNERDVLNTFKQFLIIDESYNLQFGNDWVIRYDILLHIC